MTISVVNQDLIDDLNLFTVDDLADVVPSVEAAGESFSNRLLRFRGLLTRNQLFEFMPRQLDQNGYNVGRVDIVRGANSLIYGQAAPGGKANFLVKRADFSGNETSLEAQIGDNANLRSAFDTNYVINDKLAIRVMGTHQQREFDQKYKEQEFNGATVGITYRPTDKTQFQLHVEGVDSYRNSPPSLYEDQTNQYGYTGVLDGLPATKDVIDLLDSRTINYMLDYQNAGSLVGATNGGNPNGRIPDFFQTEQDLKDFYTRQILIPNPDALGVTDTDYPVTYGDTHNMTDPRNGGALSVNERDVTGHFIQGDVTHSFTDNLQGKLSLSHEEQETSVTNRGDPRNVRLTLSANNGRGVQNADGSGRRAYADGLFIQPFWQQSETRDDTKALRGTLSWTKEMFGESQQFLLGLDIDRRKSKEKDEVLLNKTAPGADGEFKDGPDAANDYFQLDQGYPNSGVGFDTTGDSTVSGNVLGDPNASRIGTAGIGWFPSQTRSSTVDGQAVWMAAQNKFFGGRLHTLTGVRFDFINVRSRIDDIRGGNDPTRIDEAYRQVSPSCGILYWLNENVGVFANYAKSIESPNGWALDPLGNSVPPELGTGIEAGFKFDFLDGKMNGQLIYFHILKENERKSNFNNAILQSLYPQADYPELYPGGDFSPIGRNVAGSNVVSEGVEFDLYYNPTPSLSLFLGYAYVDTTLTESPGGVLDGQTLPGTAHHNANFTARYAFKEGPLKGWYVGANEKYRSRGLFDTLYEDINQDGKTDDIDVIDGFGGQGPQSHEIWLDYQLETAVFVGWRGKFGSSKQAPVWNFQLTVNNVFDDVRLVSTGQARYTEGRTVNFKASVKF